MSKGHGSGDHDLFAHRVRERATAELSSSKPALERLEYGEHARSGAVAGLAGCLEKRASRDIAPLEVGRHEQFLRSEMIVERSPGDTGSVGNRLEANRRHAVPVEECVGGGDNGFARRTDLSRSSSS